MLSPFIFLQLVTLTLGLAHTAEKHLQEDLIDNYNRLVRPVEKNSDLLIVRLGIKLTQILDVDEKNQVLITNVWLKHMWRDVNLQWDPEDYENITTVSIPSSNIWVPDIILFNSADGKYEITLMTRANIDYTGMVVWEPPAIYKSSCIINVEFFPFDVQHCVMKFGSWTYEGDQVDLVHVSQTRDDTTNELTSNYIPYGMDLEDFYQSHEWDIMAVPATRNINGDPSSGEFYPDLTFNITLKRKTLFYTCNLIVPCVSISFLTVLTFYLPSECREKISLCISILLALTVFVLLLNDLIPPTSLVVPLIAKYLLFTVVIVTLSNLVSVVVLNVYFRSPSTHRMPNWARHLFLSILPKFLLMKRPPISSSLSASYSLKEFAKAFLRTRTVESGEEDDVGGECDAFHENEEDREVAELKRLLNVPTGPKSLRKRHYRTRQSYQYYLDQMEAVTAVNGVFENLKYEDETNRQEQEWKYMSLVIDRLFLVLFTLTCIIGSCTIILQAPSLYDRAVPIDIIKSRRFKR